MTGMAELALIRLEWAIFAYFLLVNGFYLVLLGSAIAGDAGSPPPLSRRGALAGAGLRGRAHHQLLAPAYNEEATCGERRSLLALDYPELRDPGRQRRLEGRHRGGAAGGFDLVAVHTAPRSRANAPDPRRSTLAPTPTCG